MYKTLEQMHVKLDIELVNVMVGGVFTIPSVGGAARLTSEPSTGSYDPLSQRPRYIMH